MLHIPRVTTIIIIFCGARYAWPGVYTITCVLSGLVILYVVLLLNDAINRSHDMNIVGHVSSLSKKKKRN